MIVKMDQTECDIEIFSKVINKFKKCGHSVEFNGQRTCELFDWKFCNSTDIFAHCSSCQTNRKDPTSLPKKVRFP